MADPTSPRLREIEQRLRLPAIGNGGLFLAEDVRYLLAELTAARLALSTLQKEHEELKARVGRERLVEGQDLPRLSKGDK